MNLKREIRCAAFKSIFICSGITLFLGILSALFCGRLYFYYSLILPVFSLTPELFRIIWSIMFILIGGATGIIAGNCDSCRKKRKIKGLILYIILLTLCYSWYPVFFGMKALFVAFLINGAIVYFSYMTMKYYVKVSLIAGFSMLVFSVWTVYCLLLSFCVLIIN